MNYKHGHSRRGSISKTYRAWREMIQRCERPNHKNYARYGGRGIAICSKWHDFEQFLSDMGEAPTDKTLGRIDNDGGYSKSNCEWQTRRQQSANTRRSVILTFGGKSHCISEWSRIIGVHKATLWSRLRKWGAERALTHKR